MVGCRPFTDAELELVLGNLRNPRDRCLFILGVRTGFRISELLSLRVRDCLQFGEAVKTLSVERRHMKGHRQGRSVPLHEEARKALRALLAGMDIPDENAFLFPISRQRAHRILKEACHAAQLSGKVATHSMRKTFARRVYRALKKDLINTQKAMGHASVASTASYLAFEEGEIENAILGS